MHANTATRQVRMRRIRARSPETLSRHWFGNREFDTAFFSCLNLFVPPGEEFFIRTLKEVIGRLDTRLPEDHRMRAAARAFMAQEGQHASQHRMLCAHLETHGFDAQAYLSWLDGWFHWIDRNCTPEYRLSLVAALEHLTAAFADTLLRGQVLERAEPNAANMMKWHAAEELEHKSVSYDLLQRLAPSYPRRIAGLVAAFPFLVMIAAVGMAHMLAKDRLLHRPHVWQDAIELLFTRDRILPRMAAHAWAYLKPGFHPNHILNEILIAETLGDPSVAAELVS